MSLLSRRSLVRGGSLLGLTLGLSGFDHALAQTTAPGPAGTSPLADEFPSHTRDIVREVVAAAHGNFDKVRERVEAQRTMALATWDWGFGDFETAIDAASHVGNRPIAEYLIGKGARPTPFTAAMLGHLDALKALVATSPGLQRTRGPHGITLMAHAKAGGPAAAAVVSYLETLGDADPRYPVVPLTDADLTVISGAYAFGPSARDRFTVDVERGVLGIVRPGGTRRMLFHLGEFAFFPSGADAVRIRVEMVQGRAVALTVHDPGLLVRANRV